WYAGNLKARVYQRIQETNLMTLPEAQKDLDQFVDRKVPTAEVVTQRAATVLADILRAMGAQVKKLTPDREERTILADFMLERFRTDLNLYRPDFLQWRLQKKFIVEPNAEQMKDLRAMPAGGKRKDFFEGVKQTVTHGGGTFTPFDQGYELAL